MVLTTGVLKKILKILILITLLILYYVTYNKSLPSRTKSEIRLVLTETPNISCHYIDIGDALPSAEEGDFSPPPNSIFFHETSCRGGLNSRQACAVESAARAHPHYQIHVLFSAPVNNLGLEGSMKKLRIYKNIHLARVHIIEYVKGSPLESLVVGGALNRSVWPVQHTSDVLRLITLYKWGGVYLDLDIVVARPLTSLAKNWAAWDTPTSVGNGVLSFSRDVVGRIFSKCIMRILTSGYRADTWADNGPGAITRFLKSVCSTDNVTVMSAKKCLGFEVYGPELFYPITWEDSRQYFEPVKLNVSDPYTYHVFSSVTHNFTVPKDSSYAGLAKKYCPAIYAAYGDKFGT